MSITILPSEPDEILARIKEYAARAKQYKPKKQYRPPTAEDFAKDRQILCFDQSLGHCGWAVLNSEQGYLSVPSCGVIRQPKFALGERGFAATLTKSLVVSRGITHVLRDEFGAYDAVVAEMPSVAGHRTESSLVALVNLVQCLDEMGEGLPDLVSRNRAAANLCGDRLASKQVSGALVDSLVGDQRPKSPWNEHIRDAVFVGLQHLYEEQRGE